MCTMLEFVSGGGIGREEDIFLTFNMWVLFFYYKGEVEGGNNKGRGREEGGREGGIISAERLGHYPLQRIPLCHFFSNHAGWLWI